MRMGLNADGIKLKRLCSVMGMNIRMGMVHK